MSHVADARTHAEATLRSTCRVTRAGTGPATVDDTTLVATRPPRTTVWEGPCSVGDRVSDRDRDRAGVQLDGSTYSVAVPVACTGVQRGDQVEVLTVGPDGDPDLVGARLTVDQVPKRSVVVLRRLVCVDTSGTGGRLP